MRYQKILSVSDTIARTGDGRSTHYARTKAGTFTRPVKRGKRSSGWPEEEVEILIAARAAGKSDEEIRALVIDLEAARQQIFADLQSRLQAQLLGARRDAGGGVSAGRRGARRSTPP